MTIGCFMRSILTALLLLPALAFGEAADEQHRREKASWLQNRHVIQADDVPLTVESWMNNNNIPWAKDTSLKEMTVAVNVTEASARPKIEALCEAYPDSAGWTIYVMSTAGRFTFATTCPSQG